ncbi:MAG: hypothetical protein JW750_09250 [Anaerolineaceae bacterium]|nr:hypothetical protein [Anaerolineaceae bacterium]
MRDLDGLDGVMLDEPIPENYEALQRAKARRRAIFLLLILILPMVMGVIEFLTHLFSRAWAQTIVPLLPNVFPERIF